MLLNRGERARLDGETKPRGEAHGAQHAQLVLREAERGLADGADDAAGEVLPTTDDIEDAAGEGIAAFERDRIEQKAVDGEVAALHILCRIPRELDCVGAPAVGVGSVAAKGSDLCGDALAVDFVDDEDYAEVRADGFCASEGLLHDIGRGG
ncbi:MAG TPA: hypothetical protein VIG47_14800, partial [Gemmatimonadaceae bacterium]